MSLLLSVPNVSEGRDRAVLDAIGAAFATGARVLDRHAPKYTGYLCSFPVFRVYTQDL